MAKKPTARSEFVMFDVIYEDGSQRSNSKVDASLLGGLDGEGGRILVGFAEAEVDHVLTGSAHLATALGHQQSGGLGHGTDNGGETHGLSSVSGILPNTAAE